MAAGQSFSEVVIGVSLQGQTETIRYESAKTLPGRSGKADSNRVLRQPFCAVTTRDFAAENRPDRAVRIANRQLQFDRRLLLQSVLCKLEQQVVHRLVDTVIL